MLYAFDLLEQDGDDLRDLMSPALLEAKRRPPARAAFLHSINETDQAIRPRSLADVAAPRPRDQSKRLQHRVFQHRRAGREQPARMSSVHASSVDLRPYRSICDRLCMPLMLQPPAVVPAGSRKAAQSGSNWPWPDFIASTKRSKPLGAVNDHEPDVVPTPVTTSSLSVPKYQRLLSLLSSVRNPDPNFIDGIVVAVNVAGSRSQA